MNLITLTIVTFIIVFITSFISGTDLTTLHSKAYRIAEHSTFISFGILLISALTYGITN